MSTIHKNLSAAECHEPKEIIAATTADAGKVITPSASSDGVGQLRRLTMDEIDPGSTSAYALLSIDTHTAVPTSTITVDTAVTLVAPSVGAVVTVQLPDASANIGKSYTVKRIGSDGTINLTSAGGTIDTLSTISMATSYDSITVLSDGTNWWIV